MSGELIPSDRAPGLHMARGVAVPDDARIAPHVTIHTGAEIGAGVSLEQGAIVGRPQQIDELSRSPRYPPGSATVIGDDARVGSNSVVVAGARIERGAHLGDLVLIREGCVIGERAMIGRASSLAHGIVVGSRTRLQNCTIVGAGTEFEDDVLVGPNVTFISDATMGRRDLEVATGGILVRRASRIGTGAIVFPGVEIGPESVVGAASIVRANVPERTVVTGSPARRLRDVRDDELLEAWRA